MVECELTGTGWAVKNYQRFNRYMVECELRNDGCNIIVNRRFNRYMVECEFKPVISPTWITSF